MKLVLFLFGYCLISHVIAKNIDIAAVVQINAPVGFINIPRLTDYAANMTATQLCLAFGYEAWIRAVNRNGGLTLVDGSIGVPKLVYYNVGPSSPSQLVMSQATGRLTSGNYSFILTGAINPVPLANGCKANSTCNVVSSLLSTASLFTSPNGQRTNPFLFSVLRQTINSMVVPADLMFNAKVKTATVVTLNGSVLATEAIQKLAEKNIVTKIQAAWSTGGIVEDDVFQQQLDRFANDVTDILVIVGLTTDSIIVSKYIDEVAKRQLNYGAIIVPSGPLRIIHATGNKNVQYAHGTDPWHYNLKGIDFDVLAGTKWTPWTKNGTYTTALQFLDDYLYFSVTKDGYLPRGYIFGALGAQAISCVHIAINMGANPDKASEVSSFLSRAYEPGLIARISFQQNSGVLVTNDYAYQIVGDEYLTTAPLGIAELTIDQAYPAPLWEERIMNVPSSMDSGYIAASVFVALFGLYIALMLIEHGASAYIRHYEMQNTLGWLISTSIALGIAMWGSLSICTLELKFKYLARGYDVITYDLTSIMISLLPCMVSAHCTIFFMTFFGLKKNSKDRPNKSQTSKKSTVVMPSPTPRPGVGRISNPAGALGHAGSSYMIDMNLRGDVKPKSRRILTTKAILSSLCGGMILISGLIGTYAIQTTSIISTVIQTHHVGAAIGSAFSCLLFFSLGIWIMFHVRRTSWRGIAPVIMSVSMITFQVMCHQLASYTRDYNIPPSRKYDKTVILIIVVSISAAVYFVLVIINAHVLGLSKDAIEEQRNQLMNKYQQSIKHNESLKQTNKRLVDMNELKDLVIKIVQLGPMINVCQHPLVTQYVANKSALSPPLNSHFYEKLNSVNLFEDPVAAVIFGERFISVQASPENYEFLIKVRDYEQSPDRIERLELGKNIADVFLNRQSAKNLNIEGRLMDAIVNKLIAYLDIPSADVSRRVPPKNLFDEATREIRKLVNTNEIAQWNEESESYKICQQLVSKIKTTKQSMDLTTLTIPGHFNDKKE